MTTLADYEHWLRGQGGSCKSGIAADEVIGMVPLTKLVSPTGQVFVFTGHKKTQKLSPSMLATLDRRLGVKSPFSKQQLHNDNFVKS